jgi:ferredoxin-nitrite reductase
MSDPFTPEQVRYLEGLTAGIKLARQQATAVADPSSSSSAGALQGAQLAASARGESLTPEELLKRERHPLDRFDELVSRAHRGEMPKGGDVFMTKYFGLFATLPAQDGFMCRMRLPGGFISATQLTGVADVAEQLAGGYAHVTTRANLQLRQIAAAHTVKLLEALDQLHLSTQGSGADNVRNITASPLSGIDRLELIDVRPFCAAMDFRIRSTRDLYALPRKFNIAFDGGGAISCVSETNDLAFLAERSDEGAVRFRVLLGGITGHGDLAADTQISVPPDQVIDFAVSVLKVFIRHGHRGDRKQARLKYVIERLGLSAVIDEIQKDFNRPIQRSTPSPAVVTPTHRIAHIGVHPQQQAGLNYAGVCLTGGLLTAQQMRGLAELSHRLGSGSLALTVWQNIIVRDVPDAALPALQAGLAALGLATTASSFAAGMIACTGNQGCRFANADTKAHARSLTSFLENSVADPGMLNIHLTGCPNSCAQHRIGDIGLLGTRVIVGDDDIEGYHLFLGGGYGSFARIGESFVEDIPAAALNATIQALIESVMTHAGRDETFAAVVARLDARQLMEIKSTLISRLTPPGRQTNPSTPNVIAWPSNAESVS